MTNTNTTHRLQGLTYTAQIDVLRTIFATPGCHVLHATSADLDVLTAEAQAVIDIHHRNVVVIRTTPLVAAIHVGSTNEVHPYVSALPITGTEPVEQLLAAPCDTCGIRFGAMPAPACIKVV